MAERYSIGPELDVRRGIDVLKRDVDGFRTFGMQLARSLDWPDEMRQGMINRAFGQMLGALGTEVVFTRRSLPVGDLWTLNLGVDGGYDVHLDASGNYRKFGPIHSVPERRAWQNLIADVARNLWGDRIPDAVDLRINGFHPQYLELRGLLDDGEIDLVAETGGSEVSIRRFESGVVGVAVQNVNQGVSEEWEIGPEGPRGFTGRVNEKASFSGHRFRSVGVSNGADGAVLEKAFDRLMRGVSVMSLSRR